MSAPRAVAAAAALYALVFFALGVNRYATYHSGADLGLFVQTIAGAFHGFSNTVEGQSHFAYHFSPVLYVCAPALWVTHSALALVAIQAIATALCAPALFLIARKRTSEGFAALLACTALLYPPLQGVTFTEFHETAFMPATIAWLLWAIDAGRWRSAYVLLALALGIKEDQAPAMIWLGAAVLIHFRGADGRAARTFGLSAIAAAATVFAAYFTIVRPLAGVSEPWHPAHFYAWNAPGAQLEPLGKAIGGRLTYLIEAFGPLLFIPLRSPVVLLALPGFAEVLASKEALTYTMGQHYPAVWVPYVLVAFVLGASELRARAARPAGRWAAGALAACLLVGVAASPLHFAHFLRPRNAADAAADRMIGALPAGAAVGTHDEFYAHLGFDPNAAIGLERWPHYALFDERYSSTAWVRSVRPQLTAAVRAGVYRRVASDGSISLYVRPVAAQKTK